VIAAAYRLADLTCPGSDSGSGGWRVGVVLGLEGHHDGRVDLAAGRRGRGQTLKVPFEAGGGVHLHKPRHGVAWIGEGMRGPVGKQDEAARWGGELPLLHGNHDRAL
jgi:hypothetical protein